MTNKKNDKRPTHLIWQVIGDSEDARWIRVGAGWLHKDGKGIGLQFDSYPVVGRTVIREMTEREPSQETPQGA